MARICDLYLDGKQILIQQPIQQFVVELLKATLLLLYTTS